VVREELNLRAFPGRPMINDQRPSGCAPEFFVKQYRQRFFVLKICADEWRSGISTRRGQARYEMKD